VRLLLFVLAKRLYKHTAYPLAKPGRKVRCPYKAATSQARMASAAFASPPLRLVALYGMSHNTLARACWPAWPCRQRTEGKGNPGCTLNDHRRPRCEAW